MQESLLGYGVESILVAVCAGLAATIPYSFAGFV
jgi:hypothetical protein